MNTTETYKWNDEPGSRSRAQYLFLVSAQGELHQFDGRDIPGVVVVQHTRYVKAGKWSYDDYALTLGTGVTARPCAQAFSDGSLLSYTRAGTWQELAAYFHVALPVVRKMFTSERWSGVGCRLDSIDEKMDALEASDQSAGYLTFTWGAPTPDQKARGFWDWDISCFDASGEAIATLKRKAPGQAPDAYQDDGPVVVIRDEHSPGRRGGYLTLTVDAPVGTTFVHEDPDA